jgi:transglutaminase-like putative cysteine protease
VSGYLHPKAKAKIGVTIDGQSHAWVQAWTGGWWDYDPTNDKEINEQYVSVGGGRDYADVSPLKGIYSGARGYEGRSMADLVAAGVRSATLSPRCCTGHRFKSDTGGLRVIQA